MIRLRAAPRALPSRHECAPRSGDFTFWDFCISTIFGLDFQKYQKVKFPDPGGILDGWAMLSMLSGSQFITHIIARDDCGARSG